MRRVFGGLFVLALMGFLISSVLAEEAMKKTGEAEGQSPMMQGMHGMAGGSGMKERVDHPTQKPLALCDKLTLSARQHEGYVLVPFSGSGSECVSAKKNGLDFIGFEINPDYIKTSEKRLKNTKKEN